MPAAFEVGGDARLERRQPTLLEPRRLGLGEGLVGNVGERRAPPERERLPERVRLPRGGKPLEALDVELVRLDPDDVAGRPGEDPFGAQRLAERMHVHLQRAGGALGRGLAPDPVDETIRGDRLVGLEQQQSEQRPRPFPAERQRNAVVSKHLQRPQQPEFHPLRPSLSRS